ncbi:MAG: excinuclease ABC subunit UvrC, partial [Verrucomicrobia bacterium]|nr:excinuclease ABC subunit UvrC [Verrucomicrobiota bacterium]
RLLDEANGRHHDPVAEGGQGIPRELQKAADEAARRVRNKKWKPAPESGGRTEAGKWGIMPDLILIDGGKGQLNAAAAQLQNLGLETIPVIGLAKEFEDIYMPGRSEPLRLGLDNPATKLLQRIRDESHRIANSYNAQLRLKRVSESVLDEFPGIGDRRKQALLKKFGSVQRLRIATVEQIASVPGFGGAAAAELKKFLEARGSLPGKTSEEATAAG